MEHSFTSLRLPAGLWGHPEAGTAAPSTAAQFQLKTSVPKSSCYSAPTSLLHGKEEEGGWHQLYQPRFFWRALDVKQTLILGTVTRGDGIWVTGKVLVIKPMPFPGRRGWCQELGWAGLTKEVRDGDTRPGWVTSRWCELAASPSISL